MSFIRHNILRRSFNYLVIRLKTAPHVMSLNTVKTDLAAESKKRTAAYFERVNPPLPEVSAKGRAAAKAISSSNFGCAMSDVAALVSLLIGEDITRLVKPPKRPEPPAGVIIVFLSERIAPDQWIPELSIGKSDENDSSCKYVNNYEEGATTGLNESQLNGSRKPTDAEIDAFFDKMPVGSLRLVLASQFGVDVMVQ